MEGRCKEETRVKLGKAVMEKRELMKVYEVVKKGDGVFGLYIGNIIIRQEDDINPKIKHLLIKDDSILEKAI